MCDCQNSVTFCPQVIVVVLVVVVTVAVVVFVVVVFCVFVGLLCDVSVAGTAKRVKVN